MCPLSSEWVRSLVFFEDEHHDIMGYHKRCVGLWPRSHILKDEKLHTAMARATELQVSEFKHCSLSNTA